MNEKIFTEHRLISFDETPLFYRRFRPKGAHSEGLVLIVHGMGEHGGRYVHVAEYLSNAGYETVIPDLRGFGQSGGRRAWVRRFSDFYEDIAVFQRFLERTAERRLPFFLLGHSFGGLVASGYVACLRPQSVTGLVLSSPLFGIAFPIERWRHALEMLVSHVWSAYSQPNRVDAKFLTHDAQAVERYRRDPLMCHQITAGLYREFSRTLAGAGQMAEAITLPVLLLQAGEDRVVDKTRSLAFFERLASRDKEVEIYSGFYHEIFNEIRKSEVLSRLSLWLKAHSPGIL